MSTYLNTVLNVLVNILMDVFNYLLFAKIVIILFRNLKKL